SCCRTPMVSETEVSGFFVTQQTVLYCELADTAELADHGTVRVDYASREVPTSVQERRNIHDRAGTHLPSVPRPPVVRSRRAGSSSAATSLPTRTLSSGGA